LGGRIKKEAKATPNVKKTASLWHQLFKSLQLTDVGTSISLTVSCCVFGLEEAHISVILPRLVGLDGYKKMATSSAFENFESVLSGEGP
jgi:hypothetical protein